MKKKNPIRFIILAAALWLAPILPAQQDESMLKNEGRAVATVRLILTCAIVYQTGHPDIGFPAVMSDLDPSGINCLDAKYGEPVSEGAPRDGYRFYYRPSESRGEMNTGFEITARPESYGGTGTLNLFTDDSGIIRSTTQDRAATSDDPPMKRGRPAQVRRISVPEPDGQEAPDASAAPPPRGRPSRGGAPSRRMNNEEARAVGLIRLLITCAIGYQTGHPNLGYPADVRDMGMDGDRCIEEPLNFSGDTFVRGGYQFAYRATRPVGSLHTSFEIVVRPEFPGGFSTRSFFADDSGVIRFTEEDRAATVKDRAL